MIEGEKKKEKEGLSGLLHLAERKRGRHAHIKYETRR